MEEALALASRSRFAFSAACSSVKGSQYSQGFVVVLQNRSSKVFGRSTSCQDKELHHNTRNTSDTI
jgi:hypothetical protein